MRNALPLVLALAACRPAVEEHLAPARPVPSFEAIHRAPPSVTRLRVGLMPYMDAFDLQRTHQPLMDWLSNTLEVPVELKVASSYDQVGDWLGDGTIDVAELSPYPYVRAAKRYALKPLVTAIADGSDTASGYVVVRADSPFRSLEDLKGKNFGYVDEASTTGHLQPVKLLRDRGFDPATFFGSTQFLGNHAQVLLAVLSGKVEGGATYQGSMAALKRNKGIDPLEFRIIAKTPRTPRDLYCVRADLDPELTEAIRSALLVLSSRDPRTRDVLAPLSINGFYPAEDHAYDAVRAAAAAAGLER